MSDVDLARFTRTNLLIVGDDVVAARLIAYLWPSFATPAVVRRRGERLRLPPTSPPVATIVVYDVDTLTPPEQRALYHWMDGNGDTRVVSLASKSLQRMLQAGTFDEGLYYRLNVVMLDLTSAVAQ